MKSLKGIDKWELVHRIMMGAVVIGSAWIIGALLNIALLMTLY